MSQWLDLRSNRRVWVIGIASARDWPDRPPWPSAKFALLLLTEHVVEVHALVRRALAQGLVFASSWGPGCELVDEDVDEVIAAEQPNAAEDDVVLTTSHADESLEETLEFFLDVTQPAPGNVAGCQAWVVLDVGESFAGRVEHALSRRGARRED